MRTLSLRTRSSFPSVNGFRTNAGREAVSPFNSGFDLAVRFLRASARPHSSIKAPATSESPPAVLFAPNAPTGRKPHRRLHPHHQPTRPVMRLEVLGIARTQQGLHTYPGLVKIAPPRPVSPLEVAPGASAALLAA